MQWIRLILAGCLLVSLSACQTLMPKAPGLSNSKWTQQSYQRQDQVEVQWNTHSFSFLLYQQQHGQVLELVALSLTGQQLFQAEFDGTQVRVKQRIEQMRLLPFEFLVRDILLATYPDFAIQQAPLVQARMTGTGREIRIKQAQVLDIRQQGNTIELDNVQVPYQMTFSPIENTLQPD